MTPDPILKICGVTRVADAVYAVQQGATAIGFVFWPESPRCVEPGRAREIVDALPSDVIKVGVFVNESVDRMRDVIDRVRISTAQLHGDEPSLYAAALGIPLFRSVTLDDAANTMREWPADTTFLLDASDRQRRGGTGQAVDWPRAAAIAREHRMVLAGGLTAGNVAEAIAMVRPYGVDVSSGVETAPGIKDPEKVRCFLMNARHAFEDGKAR